MDLAGGLMAELVKQFKGLDQYDFGRIFGRIAGEVIRIAAAVATGGAGGGVSALTMARKLERGLGRTVKGCEPPTGFMAAVRRWVLLIDDAGCFAAGTPVWTAQGLKGIEDIRPGDMVLARDPATGAQGYRLVLETVVTHPTALYHVTYDPDGPGPRPAERIAATGNHPFWVVETGGFVPAAGLAAGQHLFLADGSAAQVMAVTVQHAPAGSTFTTYNFTVAQHHTYFVGTGGAWVHNTALACSIARRARKLEEMLRSIKRDAPSLNDWKAFQKLVARTAAEPRMWDEPLGNMSARVMKRMLDDPKMRGKFPSYNEIKRVMEGRLWTSGLETHHILPVQWARALGIPDERLGDIPAILLNAMFEHQGAPGSFHAVLNRILPDGTKVNDPAVILSKLERAYRDWDPKYGPKMWAEAKSWLKREGYL
jgi:hypothetical protein